MRELGEPVPIVQRLILGENFPGMEEFCQSLKSRIAKAKKTNRRSARGNAFQSPSIFTTTPAKTKSS